MYDSVWNFCRAHTTVSYGVAHAMFIVLCLGAWEFAVQIGTIDSLFFGQPSKIGKFLWSSLFITGDLWTDLGWTLAGTILSFLLGSVVAILTGLLFVTVPRLERFMEPYFAALNATPRIALAPLFIIWFGLGLASKLAIGFSLAFFIVLSSTVAGMRGSNQDHITLTRTFGASGLQMFRYVTLPGAIPVMFAGLRLGLIYAMLGVVAGEIIASKNGLGQTLAYLGATFNMNGVLALIFLLAMLGVAVTSSMTALERRLLRWQ